MITDMFELWPRYGEVDQMEYVYNWWFSFKAQQSAEQAPNKFSKKNVSLKFIHHIVPSFLLL